MFASRGLPSYTWMWKPLAICCVEKYSVLFCELFWVVFAPTCFFWSGCVSFFMLVRPLAAILRIWGSFQGVFWAHLAHLFADAATLTKCNLFKRNTWFLGSWSPVFVSFLQFRWSFSGVAIKLAAFWDFCRFLRPKGGLCWGPFSQILQYLHEIKRADIEAWKMKHFWL